MDVNLSLSTRPHSDGVDSTARLVLYALVRDMNERVDMIVNRAGIALDGNLEAADERKAEIAEFHEQYSHLSDLVTQLADDLATSLTRTEFADDERVKRHKAEQAANA